MSERDNGIRERLERQITRQRQALDHARMEGDPLTIDLAEDALNSLLDRLYRLLHVTAKEGT